jgi:hypothetical protein
MYKILFELKTQYWYWFVRDKLIANELENIAQNNGALTFKVTLSGKKSTITRLKKRTAKLKELVAKPTQKGIYSRAIIANWILELSGNEEAANNFSEDGDKYKNGSRPAPKELVEKLDQIFPGSLLAYEEGPCGLFLILEARTLIEAMLIIARELLKVLKAYRAPLKNDSTLNELTNLLSSRINLNIFGGAIKLLKTIEDTVDYLFPENHWDKFVSTIAIKHINLESLDQKCLLQPKYICLESVVPIVIGFAFFRARFFDEVHYLAKVCYEEQYLKLLNKEFLMKEEFWQFNQHYTIDMTSIDYDESNIKSIFQGAFTLANPVLFADALIKTD